VISRLVTGLVAAALAAAIGTAAALLTAPAPPAQAIGAGDAIGEYVIKLKGNGFDRNAASGRVTEGGIRGRAVLSVTPASDAGDPRELVVRVTLESNLKGTLLDRATPTPSLEGRGVLVGDSLTVIGAGQTNFVNALTLRFLKKGKKVDGWWLASFPGAAADEGFVAGAGLSFKGKRMRKSQVAPAAVGVDAVRAR
jgi:hypothetical protein